MQISFPADIYPYIKMYSCDALVPKDDLPDNLKDKFDEFNYKQYKTWLHNDNQDIDPDKFTLKEKLYGRQFAFLDKDAYKYFTYTSNGLELKNHDRWNEVPLGSKSVYDMFIKYYKLKKYYLLFSPQQKLSLWQHLLMLLDIRRCYYFYGYDN